MNRGGEGQEGPVGDCLGSGAQTFPGLTLYRAWASRSFPL